MNVAHPATSTGATERRRAELARIQRRMMTATMPTRRIEPTSRWRFRRLSASWLLWTIWIRLSGQAPQRSPALLPSSIARTGRQSSATTAPISQRSSRPDSLPEGNVKSR